MFLEWWMIIVFLAVFTHFMVRSYKVGYEEGITEQVEVGVSTVVESLQAQKIIDVVKDKYGNDKIVPGDIEEFIRFNGGKDYE